MTPARRTPDLVSVVIPTFNAGGHLDAQLEALSRQSYRQPFEVIVADNGSSDTTVDRALAWSDRLSVRVIDASERRGSSFATNAGIAEAKGDLIALTDHDDLASEQWLQSLVAAAEEFDLVGGPLEWHLLNSPAVRARRWCDPPSPVFPDPVHGFLPFFQTNNLAVWAEVLATVGGFSEDFGPSADVDFCWRAQLLDFRLGFAPGAVMHYRFRTTRRELWRQQFGYGRSEPLLFSRYRRLGMPQEVPGQLWAWSVLCGRLLLLPLPLDSRHRLLADLGRRCGRLVGSVRHRCLFL